MQGKLVAQDPNDEPVEVLLEMIRAEKQKLYEEGKLKKKDLAEIMVEKEMITLLMGRFREIGLFFLSKIFFNYDRVIL